MRRATKIWLITASALILTGCVLFAVVLSALGWDPGRLSTVRTETNSYPIDQTFCNISLMTDTADIVFTPSDDGGCRVECREEERAKHSVTVENDTLVIGVADTRSWSDHIGLGLGSPRITVYLPETEYHTLSINGSTGSVEIPRGLVFSGVDISVSTGSVSFFADAREAVRIKTSTGDIRIEKSSAGSLDLSVAIGSVTVSGVTSTGDVKVGVSTGKAALTDVTCRSVSSTGTTGDLSLDHVIAAGRFSIERSTGDVKFTDCDAAELYVKTTTGHVTGSLLTDKVFITDTGTGRVDVPKTAVGGKCEIRTNTGDIQIRIE